MPCRPVPPGFPCGHMTRRGGKHGDPPAASPMPGVMTFMICGGGGWRKHADGANGMS
jgi:hypothetical protein